MGKARALVVTTFDAERLDVWSGTPHFMLRALRTLCEVDLLEVSRPRSVGRVQSLQSRLGVPRPIDASRSRAVLGLLARQVERRLKGSHYDVVFSPSSVPLSRVESRAPLTYWTDAVYGQLVGYYPGYGDLAARSLRWADGQERSAIARAAVAAYSSHWAADAARALLPEGRFEVLHFGANLEPESVERIRRARTAASPTGEIHVLWLAADWQRKGGLTAATTVARLNDRGRTAVLDIVGAAPPECAAAAHLRYHGFLSKFEATDLRKLETLLAQADVLLLPAEADCTPVVVSEAATIGLPCVVTDTGGLGEVVEALRTGLAVNPAGPGLPERLADAVESLLDHDFEPVVPTYAAAFRRLLSSAGL